MTFLYEQTIRQTGILTLASVLTFEHCPLSIALSSPVFCLPEIDMEWNLPWNLAASDSTITNQCPNNGEGVQRCFFMISNIVLLMS